MADVDLTATLQEVQADNPALDLLTDESLNAGSFLPSEPVVVDDGRVTEIKVPLAAIADLIPDDALLDQATTATESRLTELSYLRDDLINGQGMCQKFAAEAIALKPGFGGNRSINYYSKLPSQTRYTASLEEIDQMAAGDVVASLDRITGSLSSYLEMPIGVAGRPDFLWDRYSTAAAVVKGDFTTVIECLKLQGFSWDEGTMKDMALNVSFAGNARESIVHLNKAHALAAKTEYFMLYLQLPAVLEALTQHVKAWNAALEAHLVMIAAEAGVPRKFEFPELSKVSLNNKNISLTEVPDVLDEALGNAVKYESREDMTVERFLRYMADAASAAPVGEIVNRIQTLRTEAASLVGTVGSLGSFVNGYDKHAENLTFITDGAAKIAEKLAIVNKTIRATNGWAVMYVVDFVDSLYHAANLGNSVANAAWESVQKSPELYQITSETRDYVLLALQNFEADKISLRA